MASCRVAAFTYGYAVCFASLVVFGYALVTVTPSYRESYDRLQSIEAPAIATDTMATDTTTVSAETMAVDTIATVDQEALAAFHRAVEASRIEQNLRAERQSLEDARMQIKAERKRFHKLVLSLHLVQRALLMLFAGLVFGFHWRWLRRFAESAA